MKGIYKFTNIINNKSYIGQSVNIEKRYAAHKNNYNNKNCSMYSTHFYSALRKYGFDSFIFEILEQSNDFSLEELNDMEKYYINKYDSYNNGYNMTLGGSYANPIGKKLTEQQVLEIKDLLINTKISLRNIANRFNVAESMINLINSGKNWNQVGSIDFPLRKEKYSNKGELNGRSKFTDNEIINLRIRYVNETLQEIYNDYVEKCSFYEMKKILYGSQFKHLPIYKKQQKQWILNGTCIDYPRIEE